MRPTIGELLARLETTFNEVILPEVGSEYAKTRALVCAGIINHLRNRWDRELPMLRAHINDYTQVLSLAAHRLRVRTEPDLAQLAGAIDEAVVPTFATDDVHELQERCAQLAGLVEELVSLIEQAELVGPDRELADLRTELRATLRRVIDRDLQLVAPPQHGARGAEVGLEDVLQ